MLDGLKKAGYLGIGLFSLTREQIEKMVDDWAKKGEVQRRETREIVEELVERGKKEKEAIENAAKKEVDRFMGRINPVTRKDLERLEQRLARIEKKLGLEPIEAEADNDAPSQEVNA
ncbi:MAG: polyhydroxyalkanoate synthesis regulator [Clostridia bacterium]|nr:polyhydroxyalkanoate synthesis regulator [Clostridia bacterium]